MHVCDMPYWGVSHDSFMCMSRLIHMRAMTGDHGMHPRRPALTKRLSVATHSQRRQSLDHDSMTIGPYGTYDAQTYYFNPNGISTVGDNTMYQPEIIVDGMAPEGERLMPWKWDEAVYQDGVCVYVGVCVCVCVSVCVCVCV